MWVRLVIAAVLVCVAAAVAIRMRQIGRVSRDPRTAGEAAAARSGEEHRPRLRPGAPEPARLRERDGFEPLGADTIAAMARIRRGRVIWDSETREAVVPNNNGHGPSARALEEIEDMLRVTPVAPVGAIGDEEVLNGLDGGGTSEQDQYNSLVRRYIRYLKPKPAGSDAEEAAR